ncbi:hypothetical protein DRV84_02030 [Rhodosalinus sediminis]|jgi:hypothetical protein|uniref:Uncharacterized protein n=1 Tax=Rhodosalinus sediminis TaxID=1940533 RepID=A0A3D9BY06_9RHOB|nr:hypothetical protein [Rhodosalinus sediminis]REC58368.1 hypothetical protein DRV84_02030 [Rhodosalinus sediminis]
MTRNERRGAGRVISAVTFAGAGAVFGAAASGGAHGPAASVVLALSAAACFGAALGPAIARRTRARDDR